MAAAAAALPSRSGRCGSSGSRRSRSCRRRRGSAIVKLYNLNPPRIHWESGARGSGSA